MATLFSHFYNEALLLPYWIRWHAQFFDKAVLVDYQSTDDSVRIIRKLAPKGWEIRPSKNLEFGAALVDQEMMRLEEGFPGWKLILNTTEFLLTKDLNLGLDWFDTYRTDVVGIWSYAYSLVDTGDEGKLRPFQEPRDHLPYQRTKGFLNFQRSRLLHKAANGSYHVGRHGSGIVPNVHDPFFSILHYDFSPFPECLPRKLQIKKRIPASDAVAGLGYQHQAGEAEMRERHKELVASSTDLRRDPLIASYFKHLGKHL
jgi:hypothetical protein